MDRVVLYSIPEEEKQMQHRWRCVFSGLTAAILLLSACTPQIVTVAVTIPPETVVVTATPTREPDPTAPGPDTLTVCTVGEPDTLYLYGNSKLSATRHVMEALYDGPIDYRAYDYRPVILQRLPSLADGDAITRTVNVRAGTTVVDAAGEVVKLAEGMRIQPVGCYSDECAIEFDGSPLEMERMEVSFILREDVTWSDGEPLTAYDSAFAYEIAVEPATGGYRELTERTANYYAQGDYRTKWIGVPGYFPPTYFLNFYPPLPKHQLEGRSPASLVYAKETRRSPLGWGPFVVDEWVAGEYIILSRNRNYFRADDELPLLDQVVFRFKVDASEVVAALIAGECDIGTYDTGFDALMPMLTQAEEEGLLRLVSTPGTRWEQLDLGITSVASYQRPDFFGDVRVRRAIAQCIDRWAIVDEVTYGRSIVPDTYLPPMHPLYPDEALTLWDYDPAAGQALLEEVGWLDEDDDGIREARNVEGILNNTPLEVTFLVPLSDEGTIPQQVAPIIKTNLADCGIRVNVEPIQEWVFKADGPEGPFFGRQFDLAETTREFQVTPACENYLSSEIPDKGQWYGSNASGYSNPKYDQACQAALQTLPGTPGYEIHHREVLVMFSEELPGIPLFMRLRVAISRPRVVGFVLDATAPSELWNIEVLDIDDTQSMESDG
jgi:peptide/nickel transport system substrate-binding protein